MPTLPSPLVVPHRFNGPAGSGNGGWTAGALAGLLRPPLKPGEVVQVRLNVPPPLDVPLPITLDDEGAAAGVDPVIARATRVAAPFAGPATEPVDWATAVDCAARYRGHTAHPFPTCFACGPGRSPDDGLRLEPGPLADNPTTTACPWVPRPDLDDGSGHVRSEIVWAALDCPGGWSLDLPGRPMVLGTMMARLDGTARVGAAHVIMGRALGQEGRKAWTESALYALEPAPRLLARASSVWIAV